MLLDITLPLTKKMITAVPEHAEHALMGHVGTHFDVMEEEFPLAYTKRHGIAFDVSAVRERDVTSADICIEKVEKGDFVAFYTGFIDEIPYGEKGYFSTHPQLSHEVIDALLLRGVAIIGIDAGGIRQGKEHVPTDRRCAQKGTFVIENLYGLQALLPYGTFTAHTYPIRCTGITGIPCRVVAEVP